MSITQKVFTSRANNVDSSTYVGEAGRLFYAQTTGTGHAPVLKYSDGVTPGGLPLSGSSLTFSGSTAPDNPHDGLLWWDTNDGRLYIYFENTWVDASPEANSTNPIITSTGSTTATDYTIDMSGPSFVHWQPSANGNRNITLSNFTPDRKVEVFITPYSVQDIFTVTNVTPSQCSNNKNNFTINGVGASAQTSFMLQIYSTTSDVGGVWIFGSSSV